MRDTLIVIGAYLVAAAIIGIPVAIWGWYGLAGGTAVGFLIALYGRITEGYWATHQTEGMMPRREDY